MIGPDLGSVNLCQSGTGSMAHKGNMDLLLSSLVGRRPNNQVPVTPTLSRGQLQHQLLRSSPRRRLVVCNLVSHHDNPGGPSAAGTDHSQQLGKASVSALVEWKSLRWRGGSLE